MEAGAANDSKVLIVPAGKWAYHAWHRYGAYICQAGRSFRSDARRIGYYANYEIFSEFPCIQEHRDYVPENRESIQAWLTSGNVVDARFAAVIGLLLLDGRHEGGESQIFLLSPPQSPETLVISHPIHKISRTGRGSAWTQGHRYVPESMIRSEPETTSELDALLKRTR